MRLYHVTFSTKWREPLLTGEIREFVLRSFDAISREVRVEILAMEAFEDHAHLLLGLEDHQKLAIVMQRLKGRSARDVFVEFPSLRDPGSTMPFWQEGYGSRYVTSEQVAAAREYIANQETHHGAP